MRLPPVSELIPLEAYRFKAVSEFTGYLIAAQCIVPSNAVPTNFPNSMKMRELREFLQYLVLRRRATLSFEVPMKVFSHQLRTTLRYLEAKHHSKNLKEQHLQSTHRLMTILLSLRLAGSEERQMRDQQQERAEIGAG